MPSKKKADDRPRQPRVRISAKKHPHAGREGYLTGETATPPGSRTAMQKVVWSEHGDEGCFVSPGEIVYLDMPPAEAKAAAQGKGTPNRREAKRQVERKRKARVTNGGAAGNARPVADPLQNPGEAVPLAEPGKRERKRREPEQICGTIGRRNGEPCRHPAGFRTDHPGTGRCWLHGGRSLARTGRYSAVERPRVQELLHDFHQDPDPMNLMPEALLLRALLLDFIERFDDQDRALMRWNLSFEKAFQSEWSDWWRDMKADAIEREDDLSSEILEQMPDPMDFLPSKPLRMADITEVGSLIDKVGGMIERIRKARSTDTFSMATVDALWTVMSAHLTQAMLEVIENDGLRQRLHTAVEEKWNTISLAELARSGAPEGAGEG